MCLKTVNFLSGIIILSYVGEYCGSVSNEQLQYASCLLRCGIKYGVWTERLLLNGDVDTSIFTPSGRNDFIMCKVGCNLPNFNENFSLPFSVGQQFFLSSSNQGELFKPAHAVEIFCRDVFSSSSGTTANISVSITVDKARETLYIIEVIGAAHEDNPMKERVVSVEYSFHREITFQLSETEGIYYYRIEVTVLNLLGVSSSSVESRWYSSKELFSRMVPLLHLFVLSEHLETGFPAVVFGWKVDKLNLPFCSLMAKWVADGSSGPPGQLSFAVDRTTSFTLYGLRFMHDYTIVLFSQPKIGFDVLSEKFHFRTSHCETLTDDISLCPPPSPTGIEWRQKDESKAFIGWNYDFSKNISLRYFEVIVSSIPSKDNDSCTDLKRVKLHVPSRVRSVQVDIPEFCCSYTVRITAVDQNFAQSDVAQHNTVGCVDKKLYTLGLLSFFDDYGWTRGFQETSSGIVHQAEHENVSPLVTLPEGQSASCSPVRFFFSNRLVPLSSVSVPELSPCVLPEEIIVVSSDVFMPSLSLDDFKSHPNAKKIKFVSTNEVSFQEELGSGSFGQVVHAIVTGMNVAIKVGMLSVQVCGLAFEYCGGGNLKSFLKKSKEALYGTVSATAWSPLKGDDAEERTIDPAESYIRFVEELESYAQQTAAAMEYIREHQFVHRDIAARNILLKYEYSNIFNFPRGQHVKIADFGSVKFIQPTHLHLFYLYGSDIHLTYASSIYREDGCRSRRMLIRLCLYLNRSNATVQDHECRLPFKWLPYEFFTENKYGFEGDVWEYGCFLTEIFTLGDDPSIVVQIGNQTRPRDDLEKYLEGLSSGFPWLYVEVYMIVHFLVFLTLDQFACSLLEASSSA
ncbi:unnamed protein product [Enterobius vermicularis]|uniref:receptor protein-tyrosine kinase n=1 Tax=Enterobius vermicularis TaxID=51028 RepID=A0A0N4V5A6_ENTVE|nr:unnamed protein product [Enterobius vermicularis]